MACTERRTVLALGSCFFMRGGLSHRLNFLLMGDVLPRETENTVYRYLLAISELRLGIRTYAERHGEAIFACEMTAGRLPAHGDDARPRVAKGSHWCPPDNARTYASRYPRGASDALAAGAIPMH